MEWLPVIDSHTEGEPTRVIASGFPDLKGATMAERLEDFRANYDHLRRGVVLEPRGHNAVVGALLTPPVNKGSECGVIFFNDAGYLGMCGHGTIGVAVTLRHLGRVTGGTIRVDTVAGTVEATFGYSPSPLAGRGPGGGELPLAPLGEDDLSAPPLAPLGERGLGGEGRPGHQVTIRNVLSYLHAPATVTVDGNNITGDIAYGGNWFFLVEVPREWIAMSKLDFLMTYSKAIRAALIAQGVTGKDGAMIDHVELYAHTPEGGINFVLCPGDAYDRSPCGTGTSAKMAALFAHGELEPGQVWRQEAVTGSVFYGQIEAAEGGVMPTITGRAYVTAESRLRFDPDDPFRFGFAQGLI